MPDRYRLDLRRRARLRESFEHETAALATCYAIVELAQNRSVLLGKYARELIAEEELHIDAVNKMLRSPGEIGAFAP